MLQGRQEYKTWSDAGGGGAGDGGGDGGGGGVFFCGMNILAFVWVGLVNVRGRKHAG